MAINKETDRMTYIIVYCVGWAGLCAAGILSAYFICGAILGG